MNFRDLPELPKIHSYFASEQVDTFFKFFGLALLIQWFIPYSSGHFAWDSFSATLWSLLAGLAFTLLAFVPDLRRMLEGHYAFLLAYGVGIVGVLWTFSGYHGLWLGGFGAIALVVTTTALVMWARNGYHQSYYLLLLLGLVLYVFTLLIPIHGTLPLVALFKMSSRNVWTILGGIIGIISSLAYIGVLVLLVMHVFLKKEEAEPKDLKQFASLLWMGALAITLLVGIVNLPSFLRVFHVVLVSGIFTWLCIWGSVCVWEAKNDGINILSPKS